MKNVLVTGGAGFIGSHVVDLLIDRGYNVTIVDNMSMGREANLHPDAYFVKMDIRDNTVHSLWAEKKFELMVHTAAQMNVRASVEDPCFDADVNLVGLLNLLEAGRKNGLKRVVFTSTGGAAYDDEVEFPTPETAPARPVSPYGIGKIASELYLNYYLKQYGISYGALRLGNVYGPRQNPFGEAGVIAIFATMLLKGKQPTINGDGLQTRDYVYCGDVARALVTALEAEFSDVCNIGTSIETNVVELFDLIRDAAGSDYERKHGPAAPGEVRRSCLANGKAKAVFGWEPEKDLKSGIEETVEFFKRFEKDETVR